MVENKKPAGRGGQSKALKDNRDNLDKFLENVKSLPDWAVRKIVMIAQTRQKSHDSETLQDAVLALEYEALEGLRAEIFTFPTLVEKVPADFARLLQRGETLALSDYEKGVAILIDADAKRALPSINLATDLEAFVFLKWESLGAILAGGFHA